MGNEMVIIRYRIQFEEVAALAEDMVLCDSRMPDQVFRDCFNKFRFEEFDWAMSADFGLSFKRLQTNLMILTLLWELLSRARQTIFVKSSDVITGFSYQ